MGWLASVLDQARRALVRGATPAPQGADERPGVPCDMSIVLLHPQDAIGARIGVPSLADYINAMRSRAGVVFDRLPRDSGVSVAAILVMRPTRRSRAEFVLGENTLPVSILARLKAELEGVPAPLTRHGPIAFALHFDVWGGGSAITNQRQPVPMPAEWVDAIGRNFPGVDPYQPLDAQILDTVIASTWPDPAGDSESSAPEVAVARSRIDLIPGQLSVVTWPVEVETVPAATRCRVLLSDGLSRRGQREIAFLVPGAAARPVDGDAFRLFETIFDLAGRGRRFELGYILELGGGPIGRGLSGVGLSDSRFFDAFEIPGDTLTAFPLLGKETAAAKSFGLTRVIARIGHHYRLYPHAPIWDLDRPHVGACTGDEGSFLHYFVRVSMPGASVIIKPECVEISVPASIRDALADALARAPANAAIALLTSPCPAGDGLLVWSAGQTQACAISPPGSKGEQIAACFLGIAGAAVASDEWKILEDGVSLLLTAQSWNDVRAAVSSGTPCEIGARHGGAEKPIRLRWAQSG